MAGFPPLQILVTAAVVMAAVVTAASYDPSANPKAIVSSGDGKARFTVLTAALVRMEFSSTGAFEDRASYSFVNRKLPVPSFTHKEAPNGGVTIETDDVLVEYTPQSDPQPSAMCTSAIAKHDAVCNGPCSQYHTQTQPPPNITQSDCCTFCEKNAECNFWVYGDNTCWTLTQLVGNTPSGDRTVGGYFSGFDNKTLKVTVKSNNAVWHPGQQSHGNMLGTIRSLDGITGGVPLNCTEAGSDGESTGNYDCSYAPISREGWAVYNDAENYAIDPETEWIVQRTSNVSSTQDYYFFGHGLNYMAALKDFQLVAGNVPSVPRFALGVWWSRYWPYTAEDLEDIATGYMTHGIPLDILVSDMAWHFHNESTIDWGGYQWSPSLFPTPNEYKSWLASNDLHTVLNLHLNPVQDHVAPSYADFARALGLDAARGFDIPSANWSFPYNQSVSDLLQTDPKFAKAYLDIALDDVGMSWWWLDDTPVWVARILYEHSAKKMSPGMAFSRWGGLGSHRYPIGFSGDVFIAWSSLAFQTAFTVKAGNVAFWWSHDIGGHRSHHDEQAYSGELYLRWLQWGAHAPILRTHPQPDPRVERRPWAWPVPLSDYMEDAMRLRGRMVPMIHTALEQFSITGISPLHGVYIDHPELDGAYAFNDTFMFCDGLFVAPITGPVDNSSQLATRSMWLPPGVWVNTATGAVESGNKTITRSYTMWEVPSFARAGFMQPLTPPVTQATAWGHAKNIPETLTWRIWHGGAASGAGNVIENGTASTASFRSGNNTLRVTINAGKNAARTYALEVMGAWPVTHAAVEGHGAVEGVVYDTRSLQATVTVTLSEGSGSVVLSMDDSLQDETLLHTNYMGLRSRAHNIKPLIDFDLHNPSQSATQLYELVNTATKMRSPMTAQNIKTLLKELPTRVGNATYLLEQNSNVTPQHLTQFKAWMTQSA